MSFVFVSSEFVEETKNKIKKGGGMWDQVRYELKKKAEEVVGKGPWSVTYYPSPVLSGNPHDYYSEAPYWWPDPKYPGGPFVRRDGERYPGRYVKHNQAMTELSIAVLHLCNAGYYLDEKSYLDRAAELIRVWFIDAETRMNPHVEYGEAISGICSGRKAGIIAMRQVDRIVHALGFLSEQGEWKSELEGMKEWLSQMLLWLTTSKIGIEESRSGNKPYELVEYPRGYICCLYRQRREIEKCFDYYNEHHHPIRDGNDGSCPRELARTRSMHYSLFNLDALTLLMEIAYQKGVDLWNFKTADGRGLSWG